MSKWLYGNAWERFSIKTGDVWGLGNGSWIAVHNIFDPLPQFMLDADLVFVDPPWNQGNLSSFYTKAGRDDYQQFSDFERVLFERIQEIAPKTCYIEIGNQFVDQWYAKLETLYPVLQRWTAVYYRKYPTNIIRGGQYPIDCDFIGIDEARCIEIIAQIEQYRIIGDLCMGRGLVGVAAYKAGKPFVGTELNERRLACLIEKIDKLGGEWTQV